MKTADVVIGAQYGDEGKGLFTDYFAARYGQDALVVRFNGGAQAGHTVTIPGGQRHVFSHFGSGSFAGAETFLSRFFVCNPLLFKKERDVLQPKCQLPVIYVDGQSPVTTPYDMMINQIAEEARGAKRHGSCGMGFGETLERHGRADFRLTTGELAQETTLMAKLRHIRESWVPQRLKALGIDKISEEWQERISSSANFKKFLNDAQEFLGCVKLVGTDFLAATRQHIIFEGAQGLLLDQDRGAFPHVTRSNTGIRNVLALSETAEMDTLNVAYITRAYVTRHGAGPLDHEMPDAPYAGISDATNVHNPWQGTLRFGWLDADRLAKSISDDLSDHKNGLAVKAGIAVTCLDQVGDKVTCIQRGREKNFSAEECLALLKEETGAVFVHAAAGPTRATIS